MLAWWQDEYSIPRLMVSMNLPNQCHHWRWYHVTFHMLVSWSRTECALQNQNDTILWIFRLPNTLNKCGNIWGCHSTCTFFSTYLTSSGLQVLVSKLAAEDHPVLIVAVSCILLAHSHRAPAAFFNSEPCVFFQYCASFLYPLMS